MSVVTGVLPITAKESQARHLSVASSYNAQGTERIDGANAPAESLLLGVPHGPCVRTLSKKS